MPYFLTVTLFISTMWVTSLYAAALNHDQSLRQRAIHVAKATAYTALSSTTVISGALGGSCAGLQVEQSFIEPYAPYYSRSTDRFHFFGERGILLGGCCGALACCLVVSPLCCRAKRHVGMALESKKQR